MPLFWQPLRTLVLASPDAHPLFPSVRNRSGESVRRTDIKIPFLCHPQSWKVYVHPVIYKNAK